MYPIETFRVKPDFRFSLKNFLPGRERIRLKVLGLGLLLLCSGLGVAFVEGRGLAYYTAVVFLGYGFVLSLAVAAINMLKMDVRVLPQDGILFAGQDSSLVVEVCNRKKRFPFLGGKFRLAAGGRIDEHLIPIISPQARVNIAVPASFPRRGRHEVLISHFASTAPLHTHQYELPAVHAQAVLVYPKVVPLTLHPCFRSPSARPQSQSSRRPGDDEFNGLRHYLAGDPLQRVHWKKSAKYDRLLVQQYTQSSGQRWMRIALCNDAGIWSPAAFETACSLLFSLLWEPATRDCIQGVFLNTRFHPIDTQQRLLELVGWLSTFDLTPGPVRTPDHSDIAVVLPHPIAHAALYAHRDIVAIPSA